MNIEELEIKSIFLDLENPRHEPYQSQDEVIQYLCKHEYVYALAQDIAKVGVNPLEIMAVIPNNVSKKRQQTYFIAEGNRRLCALKLLEDPELAPSEYREDFKELNTKWTPINVIPCVAFDTREDVNDWLERIHGGLQGGIGRKTWNAEQKTRFTGDAKNLMAQQLLDYAQSKEMISKEQRSKKLSVVQRFISSPLFKDALGIDTSKTNEIQRIRPEPDFDVLLEKFMGDLVAGTVNTRFNAPEIKIYSHELRNTKGTSNQTIPAQSLDPDSATGATTTNTKPKQPAKPRYLKNQEETEKALNSLGNFKMSSIYNSLHRLAVADHCPLLTVGLWCFIESITALNGRAENVDFQSFLSQTRLSALGLGDKANTRAMREALKRVADNGNTTKHDKLGASFSDQQLVNDFECLQPLIKALAIAATK